jgi:hypothetical protein
LITPSRSINSAPRSLRFAKLTVLRVLSRCLGT